MRLPHEVLDFLGLNTAGPELRHRPRNGPEGVEHFCQLTSVLLPMGYTLDN